MDTEVQGGGWWLAQDCSEYESARIEFREVLPMDVVFIVIYSAKDERNEKLKSKVTIPAGKKEAAIMLDITYKKSIDGLGYQWFETGYGLCEISGFGRNETITFFINLNKTMYYEEKFINCRTFAFNCIISVGERLQCGNQKV